MCMIKLFANDFASKNQTRELKKVVFYSLPAEIDVSSSSTLESLPFLEQSTAVTVFSIQLEGKDNFWISSGHNSLSELSSS